MDGVPGGKTALIRLALAVLPLYFRHFPVQRGKNAVWRRIVLPHLLWRDPPLTATTSFGARFDVSLRDILQSYLYFFGVWEPVITEYIASSLRPGDTFIDVGANIGYYTMLASQRVGPTGKVFAIEACSATYGKLLKTISSNNAANVTAFHAAVSDRAGRISVWLNQDGEFAGATTLEHVAARRSKMRPVETVDAKPLCDIIDAEIVSKARLIKIDVEGAEWAVVRSLVERLALVSERTEFIVEVNQELIRLSGGTIEALVGYFTAAGFQPFVIANRYDVAFLANKARRVVLKPYRPGAFRQADLIFRKARQ